jgi:hypothetical protein
MYAIMRGMDPTALPDLSFLTAMPRQRHFLIQLLPGLQGAAWCSAIWLSGSLGREDGDRWSNVNLHLLAADEYPMDFQDRLCSILDAQLEQGWSLLSIREDSIWGLSAVFALEDTTRGAVHFEICWHTLAQLNSNPERGRPRRVLFAANDLPPETQGLLTTSLPTLEAPDAASVEVALAYFWELLSYLPAALNRREWLAAAHLLERSRQTLVDLVIALNGARRPPSLARINPYLGPAQLEAFEKTLPVAQPDPSAWIGQAVALVVLYRWYAPQLVEIYALRYPATLERTALALLSAEVAGWPAMIQTG